MDKVLHEWREESCEVTGIPGRRLEGQGTLDGGGGSGKKAPGTK